MNIKEIISKKKQGKKLSADEIGYFVEAYTDGSIPDYQAAALLMAIYFRGMDREELMHLTRCMAFSGDVVDLSSIPGIKVDKHSTGGVGDKISLVVMPLMAALGIPAAKMSGRGLGHTGGTVDKLESVPGFRTEMGQEEFLKQVANHGIALVGQSGNLTPADKKIYALRDAIECVDSIPLIAASIMSKKIASGADVIVLDVKVGKGAFMKEIGEARQLAKAMVEIGNSLQRKTVAILTKMDQPLGREVGNASEFAEAVKILQGGGESDEVEVTVEIAAYMAYLSGAFQSPEEARREVVRVLESKAALKSLRLLISLQGGDPDVTDCPECLYADIETKEVYATEDGYVEDIDAEAVGKAAMLLGAGRMKKDDAIDHAAGIRCLKKTGESVRRGEAVFLMRSRRDFAESERILERAYRLTDRKIGIESAVIEVIA